MKISRLLLPFKSRLALMAGILTGFAVLAIVIVFVLNDSSATSIFWIGIGMSMLPLLIPEKERPSTACSKTVK